MKKWITRSKMALPILVVLAVMFGTTGCVDARYRNRGSNHTLPYDTVRVPDGMNVAVASQGEFGAEVNAAAPNGEVDGIRTRHEREDGWDIKLSTNPLGWLCGDGIGGRTYVTAPGRPVRATAWQPYQSGPRMPVSQAVVEQRVEQRPPPGAVWEYIPANEVRIVPNPKGGEMYEFLARGRIQHVPVNGPNEPLPHNGQPCYRFWYKP